MTVQIFLHDGMSFTADIADYNAADLAQKMNDPKIMMIAVGNVIVNKQAIKLIAPVQQQ
ncbi:hypothetical protein SAMN05192569_10692 [Parageobacillus thermantarcticus]|uniref:Uncharacterized protein n=1 Tax=Parageobacillus thermantarcticus TaxID=186116 RepID=A0A1I0TVY8_9BACL|nr:hypothetical protein [Parageobacillus thermantarcticus]SFA45035.1 hypothetical protein SAMN05192569_100899 [Parageobacillus thermantarcticus]SFA56089.1 hypothetical protein SAMN05192569_10692 [Parageobacillus thermantarcticus]